MKSLIRSSLAAVAARTGILASAERASRDALTVLCYHRVLPASQRAAYHDPDLVVTPETLEAHCDVLAERYTVEPLEVALAHWTGGVRPRRPYAAITFDDGYRDNFRYAAPILESRALRATFFIIAGLAGTENIPWYDAAGAAWQALQSSGNPHATGSAKTAIAQAKLLRPRDRLAWVQQMVAHAGYLDFADEDRIMTHEQIRQLADNGHEIGAHSMTHPLLPQCDDTSLAMEVADARNRLVAMSGQMVRGLCYPNGDSDSRVHQAAVRAGYTYGASMLPGLNLPLSFDTLNIQRWFMHQERLSDRQGRPSATLLRMELCGLAERMFRRGATA